MAKATGFLEYTREDAPKRLVHQRVKDFKEFEQRLDEANLVKQAARCMDCGVPSCHTFGCPVENRIPDFNELVYRNQWRRALDVLHSTNNFPEFTGRICPAPCEPACTLGINQPAVTIKQIELQIIEKGFDQGWVQPQPPSMKTGKRIAIIGSGPAGMAAAQQLARKGHDVVLMEKADRIGGLLRYGIPDFKMEKWTIDRRMEQMKDEGVIFETGIEVGKDLSVRYLQRSFDAVLIAAGASVPRNLDVPGRDLDGVHFALDFLTQQNKANAGDFQSQDTITAKDKNVVIIGGGDTGSDCVGTSIRQGARRVTQIELMPEPPHQRTAQNPWPEWPQILYTSSSQLEGCERDWAILTKKLKGNNGQVNTLSGVRLDWNKDKNGSWKMKELPGSEIEINADLVLLSMGFLHIEHGPMITDYPLDTNDRGDIVTNENMMTSAPGVFAAGDAVLGASLVVSAIYQGREAAAGVDRYLKNL